MSVSPGVPCLTTELDTSFNRVIHTNFLDVRHGDEALFEPVGSGFQFMGTPTGLLGW